MSKDELLDFEEAAKPLIKWLAENRNPHATAIATGKQAVLLQTEAATAEISDYEDEILG